MENPERDQGQPAEEPTSDLAGNGGEAAVEQAGTVESEAAPAEARKASDKTSDSAAPAKGEEADEGNPYADLLKEYVPQKDYIHAQQKITSQGQELSARDAEMAQLREDMQKLQAQARTKSVVVADPTATRREDDGYGENDDDDTVDGRVVSELQQIKADIVAQNERLNAQEDVIISSATESQRVKGVQTVKDNLGLTDELATAVQSLRERGDIDGAIALAGKAAVIADAQKTKKANVQESPEPILSGNESAENEEQEPQPLKPEDLPEDVDKRGGFHLSRIKKAFGL